ncbi:MAG TPA: hypothetical protein VN231_13285 [Allosphingosinicella sp.]|nr:hypothetical protein [Allosphingosinicella sp.]
MPRHLIHIGYPKTGSSFLQRWFDANPHLHYCASGFAGFATVAELAARGSRGDASSWRITSFEGLVTPVESFNPLEGGRPNETLFSNRTSQDRVCTLLGQLFPGAKILLVTRGFRTLILSTYSQAVRRGSARTFPEFCDALEKLVREGEDPYHFDWVIERYAAAFGADNLIVLPYELLRDDSQAFVAELENRLGLEHFPAPTDRVLPSLGGEELYWYPRISRFLRGLSFGDRRRRRLMIWHWRAARRNRLRPVISLLQRVREARPVTDALIPSSLTERLRGRSERLRTLPLYAALGRDYLFDGDEAE